MPIDHCLLTIARSLRPADDAEPGAQRVAGGAEGPMQDMHGGHAGAVSGIELLDFKFVAQGINSLVNAGVVGVGQVHAAEQHVDAAGAGFAGDGVEGVDDAAMGAPDQDDKAFRGLYPQGTIIGHGIGNGQLNVAEKVFRFGLEGAVAGNQAGQVYAGCQGIRAIAADDAGMLIDGTSCDGGHADVLDGTVLRGAEVVFEGCRVDDEAGIRCGTQDVGEPPGMIIMPVAEGDQVESGQVDAELAGIPLKDQALAGVEQDIDLGCFDETGQSVLRDESLLSDGVLGGDGDADHSAKGSLRFCCRGGTSRWNSGLFCSDMKRWSCRMRSRTSAPPAWMAWRTMAMDCLVFCWAA